jgi:capsular exopolysaccharide synthesis family protein
MVCSAGIGEGKTLVATNLALEMAQIGQRVLLIDVDLRRPRLHDAFGLDRRPGLTELLEGKAQSSDVVRRSKIPGLWVIPAGEAVEHATAFFGSGSRFRAALDELDSSGRFDWIVIDSPPALVVPDSTLIAQDVAGVVFVVSASSTKRDTARLAIDRLDAAGAVFFGCVLNRANVDRYGYYFAPYYQPEYTQYYGRPSDGSTADIDEAETVAAHGRNGAAGRKKGSHSLGPVGASDALVPPPASR